MIEVDWNEILKTGSHVIKMTLSRRGCRRGWRGARLPLSIFNAKKALVALVTYGNSHLMITKRDKQGET